MRIIRHVPATLFALAMTLTARAALADALLPPLIPGYGEVTPVESAGEKPDPSLDYKVVLNATKGGAADAPPRFSTRPPRSRTCSRNPACQPSTGTWS